VLQLTGLSEAAVIGIRVAGFVIALLWSIWLGQAVLMRQGLRPAARWLPMVPGVFGSLVVGAFWWMAIFGL
jgi:hypothetical protein